MNRTKSNKIEKLVIWSFILKCGIWFKTLAKLVTDTDFVHFFNLKNKTKSFLYFYTTLFSVFPPPTIHFEQSLNGLKLIADTWNGQRQEKM